MLPWVDSKEAKGGTQHVGHHHCPGPLQNFPVTEQSPMLHMHAAGWEDGAGRDTAGRLQSGSRARREAGSNYTAQNKTSRTGLRQKEVLGKMKEQSRLTVPTLAWPLPFPHDK